MEPALYEARMTTDESPGVILPGTLRCQPGLLLFNAENQPHEIPFTRLVLERNVSGSILLYDEEYPEASFWSDDFRILDDFHLKRHQRTSPMVREAKTEHAGKHNLRLAVGFMVAVLVIAVVIWQGGGLAARIILAKTPISADVAMGAALFAEYHDDLAIVHDEVAEQNLRELVDRIAKAAKNQNYKFEIILNQNRDPNAFALPGGKIIVNSSLLDVTTTPQQIAGVLAHEIAHVLLRHSARQAISGIGPSILLRLAFAGDGAASGLLGRGTEFLLHQQFSRDFEAEADAEGFKYLVAAGIDPRGLAVFLRKTSERTETDGLTRRLSSHPPTVERIAALDQLWEKVPNKGDFKPLKAP